MSWEPGDWGALWLPPGLGIEPWTVSTKSLVQKQLRELCSVLIPSVFFMHRLRAEAGIATSRAQRSNSFYTCALSSCQDKVTAARTICKCCEKYQVWITATPNFFCLKITYCYGQNNMAQSLDYRLRCWVFMSTSLCLLTKMESWQMSTF